jgi:hypothetical protein
VYHDAIRGRLPQYESWCEYVDSAEAVKLPAKLSAAVG